MALIDGIRTLMGIRRARRLPPPGQQPALGSNIVNGQLRMRLKYPITGEQWQWLTMMGWRTVDMRHNRRQYTLVDDDIVYGLITAETPEERNEIHQRILTGAVEAMAA